MIFIKFNEDLQMKTLSIIATSVLVSAVAMTSVQAAGMAEGGVFELEAKVMDANSDGKISKDEFMKMSAKMAAKEFMMMDMNDDGSVSMEEHAFAMANR